METFGSGLFGAQDRGNLLQLEKLYEKLKRKYPLVEVRDGGGTFDAMFAPEVSKLLYPDPKKFYKAKWAGKGVVTYKNTVNNFKIFNGVSKFVHGRVLEGLGLSEGEKKVLRAVIRGSHFHQRSIVAEHYSPEELREAIRSPNSEKPPSALIPFAKKQGVNPKRLEEILEESAKQLEYWRLLTGKSQRRIIDHVVRRPLQTYEGLAKIALNEVRAHNAENEADLRRIEALYRRLMDSYPVRFESSTGLWDRWVEKRTYKSPSEVGKPVFGGEKKRQSVVNNLRIFDEVAKFVNNKLSADLGLDEKEKGILGQIIRGSHVHDRSIVAQHYSPQELRRAVCDEKFDKEDNPNRPQSGLVQYAKENGVSLLRLEKILEKSQNGIERLIGLSNSSFRTWPANEHEATIDHVIGRPLDFYRWMATKARKEVHAHNQKQARKRRR
ncbi:MAG: hypothetical protein WC792_02730 [Candidatus Micrarchaeia archaeon]